MYSTCPCGLGTKENAGHILLNCTFDKDDRTKHVTSFLLQFSGSSEQFSDSLLLSDQNDSITYNIAKLCVIACRVWHEISVIRVKMIGAQKQPC